MATTRLPVPALPGQESWLTPLRIVLLYAAFGGLWILFSDRFLELLEPDPFALTRLQTIKGWFFILITALMLYGLIKAYAATLATTDRALKESEYRLVYNSLHDELTGLPNRDFFLSLLEEKVRLCRESDRCDYAMLLLDLDRFKVINDSLGHLVGDKLITEVAARLREVLTPLHTIARLGGDEFAVLALGTEVAAFPLRLAGQIKDSLRQPFSVEGNELTTSATIGIVVCNCEYRQPEHILRDADAAMHRAKEQGPGGVEIFQSALHEQAMRILQLERDLRKALEREELELYYQPIVNLRDRRIVGLEALIRWPRTTGVVTVPSEFIPLAEDTGLILEVGRFAFRQACLRRVALEALPSLDEHFFISVNVASPQLRRPDFLESIRIILDQTGIDPRRMKFEITESGAMENAPLTAEVFGALRQMGFGLAIDDFGTGYSSLSYLRRFPLDTLKVDQSFVKGLDHSPENQRIVQAIVTLAHSLSLNVVAEGVETEAERETLISLGSEFGQGYLFDRPVSGAEVMDKLGR